MSNIRPRRRRYNDLLRGQTTNPQQIIALHFILGHVHVAWQTFHQIAPVKRTMVEVNGWNFASRSQQNRQKSVAITIVPAQNAADRFTLKHLPPCVADGYAIANPTGDRVKGARA